MTRIRPVTRHYAGKSLSTWCWESLGTSLGGHNTTASSKGLGGHKAPHNTVDNASFGREYFGAPKTFSKVPEGDSAYRIRPHKTAHYAA